MKNFKEQRLEELANMPIHADYEPVLGLPLPLGDALLVKECPQEEFKTKSGIIIAQGERLDHAKIGIVYNRGENCTLPVKEGDVVAFDRVCRFGITHKDVNYISVASHMVYFVVPPDVYLETRFKDFNEKRREKRKAGAEAVEKREINEYDQKIEERKKDVKGQIIFPVTNK